MKTKYMVEDLGGNSKRAAILLEFTDYIFGRNVLNWENNQLFLLTDKLAHVWGNWKTKRGIFAKSVEKKKFKKDGSDKKKQLADICKLYNLKICKLQADKECKSAWGKTLRHVCNKYVVGGKICLKDHSRADH